MPWLRSTVVDTACSSDAKKLGQPEQLSYFVDAANRRCPQPAILLDGEGLAPFSVGLLHWEDLIGHFQSLTL